MHSFLPQLLSDLVVVDPDVLECSQGCPGLWDILLDGEAHPAMIAEAFECFEWHGIHRVRADQFLDIEHITVGWILCACASP